MAVRRLPGGGVLLGQWVDGLELSWEPPQLHRYGSEPFDPLEDALDELREQARHDPVRSARTVWPFVSNADTQQVLAHAHGIRRFPYQLECPSWVAGVQRDGKPGPRAFIQLRAEWLATVGAAPATCSVRDWFDTHLLPLVGRRDQRLSAVWRVSRIDLAADIAGVLLGPSDLPRFTTRARGRRAYDEPAVTDHTGRVFTGFRFGRRGGSVFARIYRKDVEAKTDGWIRERWREAGYDPNEHGAAVWRVEFEIRGALLRELQVDGAWLPREPEEVVKAHLGSLWRYASERWLVLRDQDSQQRRVERWRVTPWWRELSRLDTFGEPPATLPSLRRSSLSSEDTTRLLQVAVGALSSFGALVGAESWDETRELLDAYVLRQLGSRGFADRVAAKRAARLALVPGSSGLVGDELLAALTQPEAEPLVVGVGP